ncbi:MAG: endonuclease domain-containing protein [Flavobacteriales bacterium]
MYYIPYDQDLKEFSRKLRNNSTFGEIHLWNEIKGKRFIGYGFNRQKPLGKYIVDFYCKALNLVIEIDGASHFFDDVAVKDSKKQKIIHEMGLHLIRFKEKDVRFHRGDVLRNLEAYIIHLEEEK